MHRTKRKIHRVVDCIIPLFLLENQRYFAIPFPQFFTMLLLSNTPQEIPRDILDYASKVNWLLAEVEELDNKVRLYFELYPNVEPGDTKLSLFHTYLDLDKEKMKQCLEEQKLDYETHLITRWYKTNDGLDVFIDWYLKVEFSTYAYPNDPYYTIEPFITLQMEEWSHEDGEEPLF